MYQRTCHSEVEIPWTVVCLSYAYHYRVIHCKLRLWSTLRRNPATVTEPRGIMRLSANLFHFKSLSEGGGINLQDKHHPRSGSDWSMANGVDAEMIRILGRIPFHAKNNFDNHQFALEPFSFSVVEEEATLRPFLFTDHSLEHNVRLSPVAIHPVLIAMVLWPNKGLSRNWPYFVASLLHPKSYLAKPTLSPLLFFWHSRASHGIRFWSTESVTGTVLLEVIMRDFYEGLLWKGVWEGVDGLCKGSLFDTLLGFGHRFCMSEET